MKTVRILATNTIAQMIGKVATVSSTLIIGRFIADENGLGKIGYDQYAIIVAYAAYFYILTDFGFNAIAAKDISEDGAKTGSYLNNLLTLRLVLSIGLILVGLAILPFITEYSNTIRLGIILYLVTIATQSIFTNGNVLFQSTLKYAQSTLAVVAGSAVSLALAYVVYRAGGNLFGYLFALILGSATMAGISLLQVHAFSRIRLTFDWPIWRHVLLSALPLGMTIVFNLVYIRSGFFILSVTDSNSYGIYTMAYRIFDAVLVLPVFIVNALYPIMVRRLQEGKREFVRLFAKAIVGLIATSLVVVGCIWLLAPLGIEVSSSNPHFRPAVDVLRWLGWLVPLFFLSNILLWATITLGKRKSLVIFYAIGAVISVSLNLWLIPQYGYNAAIAVTAITEGVIVILMAAQLGWWLRSPEQLQPVAEVEEVVTTESQDLDSEVVI